ncbi:MAG TPA: low molecular weight protein arginine phosphatase [Opitutaceae bacterium]|jgi:protein-tyrosine-phosphatase|nr:low molecular weight protein arginine phosphatase [Opitutaceae bacterium]
MPAPGYILTVCTANICRSPMAEGLLRHALAAQPPPLKSRPVVSAGVAARTGELVTEYSVQAMKKAGIDISGHRSQPITQDLIDGALAVLCMTEAHRATIPLMFERPPKNIFLFREFLPPGAEKEIADPYGGPYKLYELCRDEMVEAIPSLIEQFKKLTAKPAGR